MTQVQALAILKTGANVFLTGEPGAGKTHIVNEYVAYLRRRGITPAITASTGIAATHISGMTIHSWSGIGIKTHLDKYDLDRIASTERVVRRIENTSVLIIDEISMLSSGTLSMVDAICRDVRRSPDQAFGGLQTIFVGDFFQLPPVSENSDHGFAYESPAWSAADPTVCYLTEQFRQDDEDFLTLLKAIRANTFNSDHERYMLSRKKQVSEVSESIPRFFPHNAQVDRVNEDRLSKLAGDPKIFAMSTKGAAALVESLKKGCLSPENLQLKVGAAVMFTKNVQKQGFVNGTLGTIKDFNTTTGLPIVKMRSGRTVTVEPAEWSLQENGRVRASITQLPLRLAWAITVHKSQGMSLDEAAMDLSNVFEYGQGYVALSRVRRLSGLHIFGWNARTFQVHPEILASDNQFRSASATAEIALNSMPAETLQKAHDDFAARCGGHPESAEDSPGEELSALDTYGITLAYWNENKTLAEIATVRELKEETILSHIEKLANTGKIAKTDISRLLTPALDQALPEIHAAFRELGHDKLSPINAHFSGRYPYDSLRIARMLLK
ncbi:MAG: AAA family ATPase [Candidatus Doudnabacteria bacterium RIFCSPHIGHO2_01_FULL_46_14]|uniref:AAA family ATPase n=1 Tax=Candidatus Doudnabacteria bacterium RIFCSPHIGHO2_01_FULL_46_14 TaxID=1817824 RepID=A0A1F5NKE3_9BACT|nr:MAG: AAA family ATPase [Candidatus Doudnabacteria bacterium RIFCSPHIGHO2_01_FULL_46_14]